MKRFVLVAFILIACSGLIAWAADHGDLAAQKTELARLQTLVGEWRGVAQPQRGSTKGSWIESADWGWKFEGDSAALVAQIGNGRIFSSVTLSPGDGPSQFVLRAVPKDSDEPVTYHGKLDEENTLTLDVDKPQAGLPARITLRTVAGGDRLLVLYEKQSEGDKQLVRQAEVGYTRKGSAFGKGETGGPECVVTGGAGTIEVLHDGQKYYVCCTGCLTYFKEKPEEVLAGYAARKEAEKKAATGDK